MQPDLQQPLRLAGIYLLFSVSWIIFSDRIVSSLGLDNSTSAALQTYKGLAFVLLSALLVGALSLHEQRGKRRLLESLSASNQQLQQTQLNASMGNWHFQQHFNWSVPALALLGQPADCAANSLNELLDWLHPNDRLAAQQAWQNLLNASADLHITLRLAPGEAGRSRYLLLRGQADAHGGFYGSLQDISQQQRDEQALRESEQRFRQLFEHTPRIAVQGYNDQRRVIYWNQASCDLYGYSRNEALGQPLEQLIIPVAQRLQVAHDVQQMLNGGATIPAGELQLQDQHGEPVTVYSSHLLLRNSHEQVELYCVDIDLSAQKAAHAALHDSEARYRQLVNQLDGAIFLCDQQLQLHFLNPAWAMLTGYAEHSSLGQSLLSFLHEDTSEAVARHAQQILQGQLSGWSLECRIRRADGRLHWVELQLNRDNAQHLQGSLQDIHAQHQAQELQRARNVVLDQLLAQAPLSSTLNSIANHLEALNPQMRVSIMLLNAGHLHIAAAPSLPSDYSAAVNGIAANLGTGSCGHAAASGDLVIAEDLQSHPNWQNYRELTQAADLHACWSLPFKDDGGQVLGTFGIYYREPSLPSDEDIALVTEFTRLAGLALQQQQREAARQQHEQALRQAATVFESTREAVLIVDQQHRILASNQAYASITGQTANASSGQRLPLLLSTATERNRYRSIWRGLKQQGDWEGELSARRADGTLCPLWLNASRVRDCDPAQPQYVLAFTDLSLFKDSQERLAHLAHYDTLTDLPNRLFAHQRLSHALERAQRHGDSVAVLFLDLDHFKTINDGLGHAVGDELLITVARRLQQRLRNEDTLARLGGDEFLVVLENLEQPEEAAQTAQALIQLFERPLPLGHERDAYLGLSIGISYYPSDGQSADELIRNADAALYQAKAEGRNTYRFYTQALTERAHHRLSMESKLRQALKLGEFILHYQPLVDTHSGKPLGVEALVRWNSPEGMISPAEFIPLAEDTGLIVPIGTWVLREACQQAQALRNQGLLLETVAVNLSPRQFRQPDLLKQVRDALHDSGLPADCLELEITEGALMDDVAQTQASLRALKNLGLRLAVDDFGTGYSSLAYLRRFPLDKLKIDQSFMHGVPEDHGNLEIVATIITLARSLNLTAIAEGVETAEQLEALRALGCEQSQGYLFSRPLPLDALREWLINNR
ncbi:MAG: EAL domain-containing protein [Pseudomonas sp.]|nr:EAL domain-containing protein [Pseudomonas sp.]